MSQSLDTPPTTATENATAKLVLVQSDNLCLAFSVNRVQEVLLKASVTKQKNNSITQYKDLIVPVLFGHHICPEMPEVPIILCQSALIKGGFLAIACSVLPKLTEIAPQDWIEVPALPAPWQSNGKGCEFEQITYTYTSGIGKG
ncbi:hypothetical protein V2H45_11305 [Tumidithrix elongata RA019]|uniref:Uncharacterized protein n=1 Tax=Tumidithrix elongata BACA0141 TaxID=2716417 RepID=A0AAW9PSG1_9CYAN|nr:hypothetical protein [Tumidithrix elongata RA019]